ncbi:type II toxin-antitoxin system HipA family toxin [Cupriavidus sp. BIC8F]|uniref:type II toxin-antitoxin system HipA family toxin n=1 Tax=Cupriavidus sp. BIC8F TaxID=3079014 RepID=UPI0029163EEC|nr:type II toxin-antitoxin system HipA family toxin [Cupriavidus sp. BIC8F]
MALTQKKVGVALGQGAIPLGELAYTKDGRREHSTFAYAATWLSNAAKFAISPDLSLVDGNQFRKAPSKEDSIFHFAFADTEPDGWGCRVIARDHAKRRKAAQQDGKPVPNAELSEMDYLLGVDDMSRIGAIRLLDPDTQAFLRVIEDGARGTPPLLELAHLMAASRAVEMNKETEADLRYLRGRGTSVGGMRPKCTVVDEDGHLAIGKFPSVKDDRSVTRGEVLALHLAAAAGISVADSRIVMSEDTPVALIRRFDRVEGGGRIPYLSAGSMMQASRQEDHAYTQIADTIIANSVNPGQDLEELWRRLAFNLLITNVDDHVQNHGFLHVAHGQWRLAPAFDINPFPDKDQELKLWLDEAYGPVDSIEAVVSVAGYFRLDAAAVQRVLGEICTAIGSWATVAISAAVGMSGHDLEDFAPAFENEQMRIAKTLLK